MMITGKTTSGFEYEFKKESLNNYELVELLGEMEDNALLLPKVVNMLLGKEQAKALKDHVRNEEGFVPNDLFTKEITEIFQSQSSTKNSLSLLE